MRGFQGTANAWHRIGNLMSFLHIVLGLGAVISSIAVAAKPPFLGDAKSEIYPDLAFLAACLTGVLTFLSAQQAGIRHTNGYRALQAEIDKFKADPSYKIDKVQTVRSDQQKLIQRQG